MRPRSGAGRGPGRALAPLSFSWGWGGGGVAVLEVGVATFAGHYGKASVQQNLTLPQILLHQHHPQVVCLPRAAWAESLEKTQTKKKTWQLKAERALLCSTALNSLGNTTQLSGIGTALFSCQK